MKNILVIQKASYDNRLISLCQDPMGPVVETELIIAITRKLNATFFPLVSQIALDLFRFRSFSDL